MCEDECGAEEASVITACSLAEAQESAQNKKTKARMPTQHRESEISAFDCAQLNEQKLLAEGLTQRRSLREDNRRETHRRSHRQSSASVTHTCLAQHEYAAKGKDSTATLASDSRGKIQTEYTNYPLTYNAASSDEGALVAPAAKCRFCFHRKKTACTTSEWQ